MDFFDEVYGGHRDRSCEICGPPVSICNKANDPRHAQPLCGCQLHTRDSFSRNFSPFVDFLPRQWRASETIRIPKDNLIHRQEESSRNKAPKYESFHGNPRRGSQTLKTWPHSTSNLLNPADRFIPSRRNIDVETSNHLLKTRPTKSTQRNQLDVLGQIKTLHNDWRKNLMSRALEKQEMMTCVGQKKVLRFGRSAQENGAVSGCLIGKPMELLDNGNDENGLWKVQPRKKPLIGLVDSVLELPDLQVTPGRQTLDWSSTNFIAAVLKDTVSLYDNRPFCSGNIRVLINANDVCTIRWNNAGDKLALSYLDAYISVFDLEKNKFVWRTACKCTTEETVNCEIRSICWSKDDQQLVTGCTGMISVYLAKNGIQIMSLRTHPAKILTLSLSPNNRYLLTTASDLTVQVYNWPHLAPLMEINYYGEIKAAAWHPQESGLLCIGGGFGDGSLSLWNVNNQRPMGFRRVPFLGGVEDLAWNKHSAELVVHWSYWKNRKLNTVIPVLASLDRVVDSVQIEKEWTVSYVVWNFDHTQLATQIDDSLFIWNFFGNDPQYCKSLRNQTRKRTQTFWDPTKMINHYSIR